MEATVGGDVNVSLHKPLRVRRMRRPLTTARSAARRDEAGMDASQ